MTDNQVTLSQLIEHLQGQLEKHGDVGVYELEYADRLNEVKTSNGICVQKIYTNQFGKLDFCSPNIPSGKVYGMDTTKPITKGLVL